METCASGSLNRRQFLGAVAGGAGAAVLSPRSAHARNRPVHAKRPNIVFIVADDLGYGDLSGYGRADYRTPVLDALAGQGVRLTHAYAIAPVCTPTRVGYMTGRYPARHPIGLLEPLRLTSADRHLGLDPSHPTIPSLLKGSGYTNALFGKWHLGIEPEFRPDRHGFDEFFGPLSGAVDHISHVDTSGAADLYHNGQAVASQGYLTDLVFDHAVRFVRSRPEPFFLSIQGTLPHWPWQGRTDAAYPPDRPMRGDFPADRYPAMVRALDEGVGTLLRALDESGLSDRTLVIFTSDNGGERYSSMAGLAGSKGQLREGGIRVPAFARWPGVIPAGVTLPQVATTLDWTATMLAAAGTAASAEYPPDGIDLLPVLAGREPIRERSVFWRTFQISHQGALRDGDWKYLRDEDGEYLFDLVLDQGERRDRKADEAERFERLRSSWLEWSAQMLPPVPLVPASGGI